MHPLTPESQRDTPSSGRRLRRATVVGLTAGLLGGGAAGLLVAVPSLTNAASSATVPDTTGDSTAGDAATDDTVTDDTVTDDTATDDSTTNVLDDSATGATTDDADRPDAGARVREQLQPLVDDGTITAEQADAVAAQLATSLPGRGHAGMGPGGMGHGGFGRGIGGTVVADALGVSVDELRTALQGGQSIADVAAAQGVDVQTVIDAVVAEATAHLDEEVAEGDLTQDEADARLAELTTAITERVNTAGIPAGPIGDGMGRGHHGGMGAERQDDGTRDDSATTSDDSATTSDA